VAQAARQHGASEPTTAQLVSWVRAYILFHGKRHPRELDGAAVSRFLVHVVQTDKQPLPALESAAASPAPPPAGPDKPGPAGASLLTANRSLLPAMGAA